MAKNFTDFSTATPLVTSDYIVGYNTAGTSEIKTTVNNILNLVETQNLIFNQTDKNLSITKGNVVSLSAFVQSDSTVVNNASSISNIITVNQNIFDNIVVKDPNVLYIIV